MQNYFADKITKGAPASKGNLRKATASSNDDSRKKTFKHHYFGIPKTKDDPKYDVIMNLDPLAKRQILPVTAPLQLTFSATGKQRNQLLDNLENWHITRRARVICGSDDATFTYAFDDVGTYAAAVKIGNEFIAKNDAIYHFKGSQIIMAKTILTKRTLDINVMSHAIEPEEVWEYKTKTLKPLNLGPFFDAVTDFNIEVGATLTHNMFRRQKGQELLKEPVPPSNDSEALNIHANYHGDDKDLTKWLSGLVKHDLFLTHFDNLKADIERRKKTDREREPPLGVTLALGRAGLKDALEKTLVPKNPTEEFQKSLDSTGLSSLCVSHVDEAPVFRNVLPEIAPKKTASNQDPAPITENPQQIENPQPEKNSHPTTPTRVKAHANRKLTRSMLTNALENANNYKTPQKQNRPQSTPQKPPQRQPVPPSSAKNNRNLLDNEHSLISEPGLTKTGRKRAVSEIEKNKPKGPEVKKINLDEKIEDGSDVSFDSSDEEEPIPAEERPREAPAPTETDKSLENPNPQSDSGSSEKFEDAKEEVLEEPMDQDEGQNQADEKNQEKVTVQENPESNKNAEDETEKSTTGENSGITEISQVSVEKFEKISD